MWLTTEAPLAHGVCVDVLIKEQSNLMHSFDFRYLISSSQYIITLLVRGQSQPAANVAGDASHGSKCTLLLLRVVFYSCQSGDDATKGIIIGAVIRPAPP